MAGILLPIRVVLKYVSQNLGITHEPTVGADQVGAERGGEGYKHFGMENISFKLSPLLKLLTNLRHSTRNI
jgi:hypothetical protein